MKKQFWVNILLLLISTLLISCTSLMNNNDNIVNNALNLANKQVELNQLEEALQTYDKALKHGLNSSLLYNKAVLQAELGNYEDAIKTAKRANAIYKDQNDIKILLAKLYYFNDQIEEFNKIFTKYLKKNQNDKANRILYMNLCFDKKLNDIAYNEAINLWNEGNIDKQIINVLYAINPDEWQVVHSVIN